MKPSTRMIAAYYRSGRLSELRRAGLMTDAEYKRHVEAANQFEQEKSVSSDRPRKAR